MIAAAAQTVSKESSPTLFGLTGGIACGKSFVSKLLRRHCIPVVDADDVARQVVQSDSIGLTQLIEAFGKDILLADGTLDRAKLGSMVFGNADQLNKLNAIMQPLIRDEAQFLINLHMGLGCRIVCYDAALIVELDQAKNFSPLVVASCKPETQMKRLLDRGVKKEQAKAMIASQLPLSAKEEAADVIIDTNGTKEETQHQVDALVASLLIVD